MKKNKRIGTLITALIVVLAGIVFFAGGFSGDKGGEYIGFSTQPSFDSIQMKWKQRDDVHYYEISRAEVTFDAEGEAVTLPRDAYEPVKTVAGDKRRYTDRDVETGHTYAYVVEGYKKSFGHLKCVCTTYEDGSIEYETAGLGRPALLNNGEGENHTNSKDKIYLYVQCYTGVEPTGGILYRKGSDEDKYRVIDYKLLSKEGFSSGCEILDDTVTPGVTYRYKIRTTAEDKEKSYQSPKSTAIRIPAVNFDARYDVQAMTEEGFAKAFVIRVSSDAYNGTTLFTDEAAQYQVRYTDPETKQDVSAVFDAALQESSVDGQTWQAVKKRVRLTAGSTIYLKYALSGEDTPYFGSNTAAESVLSMDGYESGGAVYEGSGCGATMMTLDLVKEAGEACCDFD